MTTNGHTPSPALRRPSGAAAQCPDFAQIVKEITPDRSLFEQIAACFSNRLEDFARYYCRDETLGKDAFQDAMLSAMRYLDTYRGDSPIEPWLRRIVVSACGRLRRGKKNNASAHIPIESDKPSTALADTSPDQELRLMLAERLTLVRNEIEKLKDPNRAMLLLHDAEEVSIADLAQRFSLSEESVKSRLKRSRTIVRDRLLRDQR